MAWGWLGGPDLRVEVGATTVDLPASPPAYLRRQGRRPVRIGRGPVGPGAVTVEGLEPATTYDVTVTGPHCPRRRVDRITTLAPPPGALTARFATISDTHLGDGAFGALSTIVDVIPLPPQLDPYPERCARAAITEAAAWGSELIIAKGDLTRDSEPAEFKEFARLVAASPVSVRAILGNHDVRNRVDGAAILTRHGVDVARQATAVDLPGVRIILAHTPITTQRRGRLGDAEIDRIVTLAAGAPASSLGGPAGPVVVAMHHAPQRAPVATHYPPGLYSAESRVFVDRLREANPTSVILAGHTHRNRRYKVGGLTVSEVGSTKDYPGQWAGYAVYEGGIRQVVRRIASPDAIAWTEASRRALFGLWGRWAVSTLEQRCWIQLW